MPANMRTGGYGFTFLVDPLTTTDDTPVITGMAAAVAGTDLTITVNGHEYSTEVEAGQVWSVTVTHPLPGGPHSVTVSYVGGGSAATFGDVLQVERDTWAFYDGAGGLDEHIWAL